MARHRTTKDKAERRHRRTSSNPECVAAMSNANFDAAPSLAEAMGLESADAPVAEFHCPQCDRPAERLSEGVCDDCWEQNQAELDLFNADYDRWQAMTDKEREDAVRWAIMLAY